MLHINIYYLTTAVHECLILDAVISHLNLLVDYVRCKVYSIVYMYSSSFLWYFRCSKLF